MNRINSRSNVSYLFERELSLPIGNLDKPNPSIPRRLRQGIGNALSKVGNFLTSERFMKYAWPGTLVSSSALYFATMANYNGLAEAYVSAVKSNPILYDLAASPEPEITALTLFVLTGYTILASVYGAGAGFKRVGKKLK